MSEHADKLSDDDKDPLNKAIEKVKAAVGSDDTADIKQATDELEAAAQAFSKVLYEKTEAAGGADEAPAGTGAAAADNDDDAIDADFEVKD